MFKRFLFLALIWANTLPVLLSQPVERFIKVVVAADRPDWTYKVGENVRFTISVFKNGNLMNNALVRYEIGPEKQEPRVKDSAILVNGFKIVDGGTMNTAGFLRCIAIAEIDGKLYRNLSTAAFDPLSISPTVETPMDFDAFWQEAKTDLSKIPLDAKMTLLPERCTEKTNVYHVNIQNFKIGARLYGILCVPKKEGKYPALLHVPGAGVRPYAGDLINAEKGIITLQIGIHGIPVNMDPSVYTDLGAVF